MSRLKVAEVLRDNYDDYYGGEDSEYLETWRRLGALDKAENIVALWGDRPIRSVVEIGAGNGAILERLEELDFAQELSALEISASGVEVIKNRGIERLVDCQQFDGYHVPYEDDTFDLAVMSHVIEHVEYPRMLLYEAKRIAKYVFVEVPLEDNLRLPLDFVLDKVGHINFYSPRTIRRLIQSCDLEIVAQAMTNPSKDVYLFHDGERGVPKYYIKEALMKLAPRLASSLFVYHACILSKSA
ncbi:MAG: class I SAM-dependent methyltransferase [Polyangiaceae bacterium]